MNLSKKIPQPLVLDVEKISWEIPLKLLHSLQVIVSINMIHIAEWNCKVALLRELAKLLKMDNFWYYMNHLELVISIRVKVIIYLIIH